MTAPGRQPGVAFALGEGWRNARSSRFMGVVLALLTAVGLGGIATADALSVARIAADEAAWVAAGGNVLAVSNDEGLSALTCERLNHATGVKASVGAARLTRRTGLANAPEANLPVVGVTPGITGFLPSAPSLDAVILTDRTAEDYGLVDGGWTRLSITSHAEQTASSDGTQVTTTTPDSRSDAAAGRRIATGELDLLGEEYSGGVALAIPVGGMVDTCFVWAEAGAKETLTQALPDLFPSSEGAPTVVADRLMSGEFARDYHQEYQTRSWRWAAVPLGAGLGLVWVLIRWVRRSEDGLYQSLGIARGQRALLRLSEWLIYGVFAAVVALVAGWVALRLLVPDGAATTPHLIRSVLLGLAATTISGALAGLLPARSPLDALKDR